LRRCGADPVLAGLPPDLRRYLFLDIEASGLQAGSYPIEIGYCGLDLVATSFLIRPASDWTEADWSITSERIHGIPRETLFESGIDAGDAAQRLNQICADRIVATDHPRIDQAWLSRLFGSAGLRQDFVLQDATLLGLHAAERAGLAPFEMEELQARVRAHYPHIHRAAPDAREAAALFAALALPGSIDVIIAAAHP
jgi:hypothetical protein